MKNTERHDANADIPRLVYRRIGSKAHGMLSRRRFIQSGLAVSGVLLTLTSRSSLGSDFVCRSPSGFLSGNASTHGASETCTGRSPGYWGTHPEQWPSTYEAGKCGKKNTSFSSSDSSSGSHDSNTSSHSSSSDSSPELFNSTSCTKSSDWNDGTRFRDVFDCYGNGSLYSEYSMMQVIWLNGNQDPYQLGAHFVAAILNAKIGYTPVLGDSQLMNMFKEWNRNGFFEPTAGVKWYAEEIVTYLQSTLS